MESLIIRCIEKFVKWIDLSQGIFLLFLCWPLWRCIRSIHVQLHSIWNSLRNIGDLSPTIWTRCFIRFRWSHWLIAHTLQSRILPHGRVTDLWLFLLSRWPARYDPMHCHLTKFYFYPLPIVIPVLYKVAYLLVYAANVVFDTNSLLFRDRYHQKGNAHAPYKSIYDNSPAIILLDPQRPQHFCGDPTRPHLSAYATSVQTIYRLLPHVLVRRA